MLKFKNLKAILILFIVICLLSISNFTYCSTYENQSFTNSTVLLNPENENTEQTVFTEQNSSNVTRKDLYLCEDIVNIDYIISGNVFIVADTVTINNSIDGNVFIVAKKVNIESNAYIYSSVFVCAENIEISGYLRDLYSISASLNINNSGYILRDLNSLSKNFCLDGIITRNAQLSCSSLKMNSETARIGGNLNYSSENEFNINPNIVKGEINYTQENTTETTTTTKNIISSYAFDLVKLIIISIIFLSIFIFGFKNFTSKSELFFKNKFGAIVGYGALGLFTIPIICFILLCTIIGIWASFALLFVYILILTISNVLFAIPLAKTICSKNKTNNNGIVFGTSILLIIVIWILEKLPLIGGLISLFVSIMGLGIVLYSIFNSKKDITTIK